MHPQWTVGNNGCVTEGTNFAPQLGAYSGTGSVYFYAGADYLQSQSVNFSSSTEICFEVWYCGPQGSGASGQNTSLAYFSFGVDDSQVGPTVPVPTNTPWTQHTYTMTLSAGNHTFSILSGGAAQYSFWFDDFYVTDCGEPPSSDFTVESPVCVGENATITYTGNASSGATYNWDFDGGNASPGSGQGPHEVNWDADGSYTISLTVDEGGSSSGATTQTVTVNLTPTADFSISGPDCYGDNVNITYTGTGSASAIFNWDFPGANIVSGSGEGPYVHQYPTPGSYNIGLDVTENGCTSQVNSQSLNMPVLLELSADATDLSCYGYEDGSITLNASGGTPAYSYGFAGMEFSTPHFDSLYSGVYNFLIEDAHGCRVALQNIILNDNPEICLDIPNVITPNGDNINDTWIIENLEMYPDAIVKVFNRWGQQMFQGSPGMDPWDGTCSETEKKVPTGAYMYSIELNNKFSPICGIITVVY